VYGNGVVVVQSALVADPAEAFHCKIVAIPGAVRKAETLAGHKMVAEGVLCCPRSVVDPTNTKRAYSSTMGVGGGVKASRLYSP
jgi:hypothetical protein